MNKCNLSFIYISIGIISYYLSKVLFKSEINRPKIINELIIKQNSIN